MPLLEYDLCTQNQTCVEKAAMRQDRQISCAKNSGFEYVAVKGRVDANIGVKNLRKHSKCSKVKRFAKRNIYTQFREHYFSVGARKW